MVMIDFLKSIKMIDLNNLEGGLDEALSKETNETFYYGILRDTQFLIDGNKPWETYEEAELACLLKLIEVVKNK